MQQSFFEGKDYKLYLGNCVSVLETFEPETVDMVFADPPYFLSNGGKTFVNGTIKSVDKGDWDKSQGVKKDFEFHLSWIRACRRIMKPNATLWVSGTFHSIYMSGFALQASGFKILNDIVWLKKKITPNFTKRTFTASHENLIWAGKDSNSKYIFEYDTMKNYLDADDNLKIPNQQMHSVWQISSPKMEEKILGNHPTQKPLELLRRIILSSTKKEDLILDPFTGSSTTGVVALSENRKFVGIDIDKNYLEVSRLRIENLKNNYAKKN